MRSYVPERDRLSMSTRLPGLNTERLVVLMHEAIARCQLDLSGATVLTEAALGAYLPTPVISALAGANVVAFTASSRYGSVDDVRAQTNELAEATGVRDRIEIVTAKTEAIVRHADVIMNSGHLRPIDARMIGWMKPTAAVPLRYESWEYRAADLDIHECRARNIAVAGTNETNPAIDVFSYLGSMAAKLLMDAAVPVYGCRVAVMCDNPFAAVIESGLTSAGADVTLLRGSPSDPDSASWDAVLVAMLPRRGLGPSQRVTLNSWLAIRPALWSHSTGVTSIASASLLPDWHTGPIRLRP